MLTVVASLMVIAGCLVLLAIAAPVAAILMLLLGALSHMLGLAILAVGFWACLMIVFIAMLLGTI